MGGTARRAAAAAPVAMTTPRPHGTPNRYRSGCRCDRCREAQAAKMRAYYQANRERIIEQQREYKARKRGRPLRPRSKESTDPARHRCSFNADLRCFSCGAEWSPNRDPVSM